MNIKLALLVRNLRQLERAYDKLTRGVPDPKAAEANADRVLEGVTNLLSDKELADNLDALIIEARKEFEANAEKFDAPNNEPKQELFLAEIKVLRNSGLGPEDILELYAVFQDVKLEKGQFVSNSEELRTHLEALHRKYKAEIEASRLQPRKQKKKRKRKVLQGAISTTLGTTVIIADSQFPPLFAFSYGLGGGALHQALRDFIGDPAE